MPKLPLINFVFLLLLCVPACAQKADSAIHKPLPLPAKYIDSVDRKLIQNSKLITGKTKKIDSTIETLQQIPAKYIASIDKKATQYTSRITSKTEKTLTKLSRWENKIKTLLEKASPETATRLFGNNQPTFTSLLQQLKKGEAMALQFQAPYNKYRDDVTTSLKYLAQQKQQLDSGFISKINTASNKMQQVATEEDKAEAMQQFIKERKKQLMTQAFQQIGKSRYLSKINKEAYYYTETLKNYKEVFSDSKKAEEMAMMILNKIPAFQKFFAQNSQLSGIFASTSAFPSLSGGGSIPIVNGIPSRAALQSFMQSAIPALGTNPMQRLQVPDFKSEGNPLQQKLDALKAGAQKEMPEFKPTNSQHTKPFKKRIEYGVDFQFNKSEVVKPAAANVAVKIGYRINDKSSAGIGLNYVAGLGHGWDKIKLTNEGLGIRTYLRWKLIKSLDMQGGSEWNHLNFTSFNQLTIKSQWQRAALIGVAKNYAISKKVKGSFQILYDFLANQHLPASQPFVFRFGYGFN
ncbi:MAG: hypothetical protein H7211_06490 [Aquabacterium sp.]|nr:hypothetical protein [Ferruginibacter sp.]